MNRPIVRYPTVMYLTLCLNCLLALTGCGNSGAAEPGARVVAAGGEPAPGLGDGYLFEGFAQNYSMGASGHILFSASANIEKGGPAERKEALWLGSPDALEPIAEVGQPVPGSADDVLISAFPLRPMVVTRSGAAGFVVQASSSPPGIQPQVLLVQREGELLKVAANGDEVPTPAGNAPLLGISQFAMTDAGVLLMGQFARRQTALWFWDYSTLRLVIADQDEAAIGDYQCIVRSLASTTLDLNAPGVGLFRVSTGGNDCPRGGMVAWDADSDRLIPVAMHLKPIAVGTESVFQSVTGDARINDDGNIALHANVHGGSGRSPGTLEMTLLQTTPGSSSTALIDRYTTFPDTPDLSLTHTILGDGLSVVNDRELVHFVRSNRDRIILRTRVGDEVTHEVVAHAGTPAGEQVAARIGDGQVNRDGEVVFTSFIDDGPTGGTYQQEIWRASRDGHLSRLAFPGQTVSGREGETIERIDNSNQSHEPTMQSTQGGRSRRMSDAGTTVFAGRLQKGSIWYDALFVASPE